MNYSRLPCITFSLSPARCAQRQPNTECNKLHIALWERGPNLHPSLFINSSIYRYRIFSQESPISSASMETHSIADVHYHWAREWSQSAHVNSPVTLAGKDSTQLLCNNTCASVLPSLALEQLVAMQQIGLCCLHAVFINEHMREGNFISLWKLPGLMWVQSGSQCDGLRGGTGTIAAQVQLSALVHLFLGIWFKMLNWCTYFHISVDEYGLQLMKSRNLFSQAIRRSYEIINNRNILMLKYLSTEK